MKLRTMLATVALGTSVLTAVPAVVFPSIASAHCDGYTNFCYDDWDFSYNDLGYEYMDRVYVSALYDAPSGPAPLPYWDPNWGNTGGGGAGVPSGDPSTKIAEGTKEEVRQNCLKNDNSNAVKQSVSSSYTVTYQVTGNISGTAYSILSASLGVNFGESSTVNRAIEVTIQPGTSWALYVEYQNNYYKILTPNGPEYATVKEPTGNVRTGTCQ
ncbi:DUF6426 family protein [Kitasatospora sp. NPDC051853]|uniref:DUF6426 family protein n=1 Tax=Kitasatospora sp. NPDC051853 TaxID=3364058 RepID=UPI00378C3679